MAGPTIEAPATYTQPSRKGKKAWRKNVDISEVQQGLDTVRDEIVRGGIIVEKESEELFTTDVKGDEEVAKRQQGRKTLKADEILAQRSAVPGLDGRKRKSETLLESSTGKKTRNGKYISHRELQRLRGVADNVNGVRLDETPSHDPWSETAVQQNGPVMDFLPVTKLKREPTTLKQAPSPLTVNRKPLAHVRKPNAGKSYNPLVGDWSALLEREGAAAVEAEKARVVAEAEALERQARAESEAAKVEAAEKEEFATDYDSTWESEWDGIHSETEQVYTTKPQRRKTPAERNKVKARKERESREVWERKQKERDAEEKRIKKIADEVSTRDRQRNERSLSMRHATEQSSDSDENEGDVELQRPRFGKHPVPQAPLEVTLPDELQDSLRRLKPEGNLLTDRYRNLLINGKVEVRRRVGEKKKAKTFRTEKWTYKDWKLK